MEQGAGVILVKDNDDTPRVLCLRIYGSYDLPKGGIENSESEFEAACRETREEAGIKDISFPWGYDSVKVVKGGKHPKTVTLFMGSTNQEPYLGKNPESGEYEHHGIAWLSFDDAEKKLHPYLRPAISWAKKKLDEDV